MSVYLDLDKLAFSQLPTTKDKINFETLSRFAFDLNTCKALNYKTWVLFAKKRFNMTVLEARIYYETFVAYFMELNERKDLKDVDWMLKVPAPKLAFILFLFNQLCINNEIPKDTDDLVYYYRANQVLAFWKDNVQQWLALLFVVLNGKYPSLEDVIDINDLSFIGSIFISIAPAKLSLEYDNLKKEFKSILYKDGTLNECPKFDYNRKTRNILLENMISEYFSCFDEFKDRLYLPFKELGRWFEWALALELPLNYYLAQSSPNGTITASKLHCELKLPQIDVPLLIKDQSGICIPITSEIAKDKIWLCGLKNCSVYIMHSIESLLVSECRDVKIYAPIVRGKIEMINITDTSISACCTSLSIRIDQALKSKGDTANHYNISCMSIPLILECPNNISNIFGPLNLWYPGILEDLQTEKHNLEQDLWEFPHTLQDSKCLVQPYEEFEIHNLPFELNKTKVKSFDEFLSVLPMEYSTWYTRMKEISNFLFKEVNSESMKGFISKEFKEWLEEPVQREIVEKMSKLSTDIVQI